MKSASQADFIQKRTLTKPISCGINRNGHQYKEG
jgi:hypothetical protein